MSEIVLNAVMRTEIGKGAHRLIYADMIPGVYYSRGEENINITATPIAMKPLIYTTNTHILSILSLIMALRKLVSFVMFSSIRSQIVRSISIFRE